MSDALFSALQLEVPATRPGYRLHRLELYNWGTFDARFEALHLAGNNALVTGDIGSGKSTLVDAVTTLMLPAHRINYNKAAGADTRERSLRTYVLGHYKSERMESSGASRPVGLRDQRSYSVILGMFRNDALEADVTLAQVFWMPGTSDQQPRRFFVTSESDLSIQADFTDFGTDPADLKKRLRAGGVHVYDHYPEYGTKLRRLLGIRSEQALDLFHQTISMKSVGNLTDFVRQHMLEPSDTRTRIASLVQHFEDLTHAHEAVRKAREQLAQLEPITAACDDFDTRGAAIAEHQVCREAVPLWVADHRLGLLAAEHHRVDLEHGTVEARRHAAEQQVRELETERAGLLQAREGVAGGRLAAIEVELAASAQRRDERRHRAMAYGQLLGAVSLPPVHDQESFARTRETVLARHDEAQAIRGRDTGRLADLKVELRGAQQASAELATELRSLQGRDSNIDSRSLALRDRLAGALGVPPSTLPFVGELIQVREDRAQWRGAAERLLRGFALSVVVPVDRYAEVSAWVDRHHLGARFVYFRVGDVVARRPTRLADADMLADCLDVKPGPYATWVSDELSARADYVCVDSTSDFSRYRRALTRQGQIKADRRHEKDDRFAIDDRARWVLGWSNVDKVDALLADAARATEVLAEIRRRLAAAEQEVNRRSDEAATIAQLVGFTDWSQLDWTAAASRIAQLEEERAELERGDAELAAIVARLREVDERVRSAREHLTDLAKQAGGLEQRLADLGADRQRTAARLDSILAGDRERLQAAYPLLQGRRTIPATLAECDLADRDLRQELTAAIEEEQRRQSAARERAAKLIAGFRQAWPSDTTELGADVQSAREYRELQARIATDDLPRFEAEFKRQLNTNTINDIAEFQAWLDQSAQTIRARIRTINESLGAIDYSPGTRINLLTEPTVNREVKAFREDLRACTDDALSADDQYSEERFRRVERIIERFRGRRGYTDVDRRWSEQVTDVRNWYVFAASERDRESGLEREHYTDSDGKSGGQKEKLAYTILAASLVYQFGLEWGVPRSRDFRFTVIDEAFGRGSDASTRYALDLFRRLGLQLLVVTPLQKVHVIEPYVNAVGFVENRTGQRSRLQTLTIEEYHAERESRTPGDLGTGHGPHERADRPELAERPASPDAREPAVRIQKLVAGVLPGVVAGVTEHRP